jgi:hypothetical protein
MLGISRALRLSRGPGSVSGVYVRVTVGFGVSVTTSASFSNASTSGLGRLFLCRGIFLNLFDLFE